MLLLLALDSVDELLVLSIPLNSTLHYLCRLLEVLFLGFFVTLIVDYFFYKPKRIKNIPSVFSLWPIWGNLSILYPYALTFKDSPCLKLAQLANKYGPVFQIRLGSKRVVVANSFQAITKLYCCGATKGNNSRPTSHTFHKILSKSGVYTVGTTPFGDSYVKSRKFMATQLLNGTRSRSYNSVVIDEEVDKMVSRVWKSKDEEHNYVDLDLTKEAQYFHLAVALSLTYGYTIDYTKESERLQANEIIYVENYITKIRSHIQNIQDYLPSLFRYLINMISRKEAISNDLYTRRERYLRNYSKYTHMNLDSDKTPLQKSLMHYYYTEGYKSITKHEVGSVCLTMVSAGLDNTPLNFQYLMLQLTQSPYIASKAYKELLKVHEKDPARAWYECHISVKCVYIVAMIKETLRLFTVLPMALPRELTKDMVYEGALIPQGTTIFMNCWAGNHDEDKFIKPTEFIPERFLDGRDESKLDDSIRHLAFGIGSRMCLGNNLAFKELYILTCKFLLMFDPVKEKDTRGHNGHGNGTNKIQSLNLNPLEMNQFPESIAIEPRETVIRLKLRDPELLKTVYEPFPS